MLNLVSCIGLYNNRNSPIMIMLLIIMIIMIIPCKGLQVANLMTVGE